MRRICCLVERWESGGIESFLCNVLTRMDLRGLEVDIVASSIGVSVFSESLQQCGVRFFELSGSQRKIAANHRIFRLLVRERKYDVLHLNAFHGLSLAYLKIAEEEGVTTRIAHSHNTTLRKSAIRPIKLAIHAWARSRYTQYATDLWACSQNAAKFLFSVRELKRRGYRFIPNGIDVERFRFIPEVRAKMRTELELENSFVIGNVGRLCYQKNQMFLLDVFAEVLKQRPDSCLLLVGEGEDRTALEDKARSLGVADKVIFYGTTDHVERLLWAMDVFALPSRFEGFPVTGVEAQAAGLLVVCSDNITPELNITRAYLSVSLDAGLERWVAALLTGHRFQGSEVDVAEAGFDVKTVARSMKAYFMGTNVSKKGGKMVEYKHRST